MNKLYYILTLCVAFFSITSCSLKEDDVFDESASQRSQTNIDKLESLLASASNGWLMEYYGNQSYGGCNVMVKFDGENATFGSEKLGANHEAGIDDSGKAVTVTSHFKIEQSMGTVISFDEYNNLFHYFSMPNNPDGYGSTDEGYYGDFEFRVMKAAADTIILRGKKNNNRIVMTPIPADKSWESIIREAKETDEYMASKSYNLTGEDRNDTTQITVRMNGSYRCLVFTYTDSTDMKQTVYAPYISNKDGFKFYTEVDVNGMKLDGLEKGDTQDYFLFHNNHRLQLDTYVPSLAEHLTTGLWILRYSGLGPVAQPKWDAMMEVLKTAGPNETEIKIYYAYIGVAQEKRAFHLTTTRDQAYYGFNYSDVNEEGNQITLKLNTTPSGSNKAGKDYYNKYKWRGALEPFIGTFKLECDNQRRPSYIKMTDVKNPDNVITVYGNTYYFMDDMSYYNTDNND